MMDIGDRRRREAPGVLLRLEGKLGQRAAALDAHHVHVPRQDDRVGRLPFGPDNGEDEVPAVGVALQRQKAEIPGVPIEVG